MLVVSRPGYGRTDPGAGPSAPEFVVRLAALCAVTRRRRRDRRRHLARRPLGADPRRVRARPGPGHVILMCPTSFRPLAGCPRPARSPAAMFNPVAEHLTWGSVHALLRRDPAGYLPSHMAEPDHLGAGDEVVRRLAADRQRVIDFLLTCRSGSGLHDRPAAADRHHVPGHQPAPGAGHPQRRLGDWNHPAHLAATLPQAQLTEVGHAEPSAVAGRRARTQTAVASRAVLLP